MLNYAGSEELFLMLVAHSIFMHSTRAFKLTVYTHQFYLFYSTIKVVVDVVGQCAIAVDAAAWQCGRRPDAPLGRVGPEGPYLCRALCFSGSEAPIRRELVKEAGA